MYQSWYQSSCTKNIRINSTYYLNVKIPISRKILQISIIIYSIYFKRLDRKCTTNPYSFLFNYTTIASDDVLCRRFNLVEKISKLIMTIDDKVRYEKSQ